ncbi:TatD family hydrolase [Candidatus Kuenenbacteria bacterium]|nr:TatD family hydrolase [Candidatus Kuenenbacteria bacterium]
MPFLIDSHAHVNFNAFKDDGEEIIRRSLTKGIWMVNVGSQHDTSKRALEIANQYDEGVYAAIGLHPIHLSHTEVDEEEIHFQTREEQFDENKYQALIDADKNHKIVAVGEIGLDYFHIPAEMTLEEVRNRQAPDFIKQLHFAAKNNLPVIIHCRDSERGKFDAYRDTLDILKAEIKNGLQLRGIKHSFDGDLKIAEEFFQLGFYISFTGVITFGKNAEDLRQLVKALPLDKILVETDCPYLAPAPHRGERNEPSFVEFTAQKIAELKNISLDKVAETTMENTKDLFKF